MGRERGWGTWLGGGGATVPRRWGGKPVGSDWMGQRLGVARERGGPTCLVSVVIVLRYQYGSLYIGFVKMQSTKNSLDGFAANI